MSYTREQILNFKIMDATNAVDKKVKLTLVGLDGNAFALLGAFRNAAIKEKWTQEEIDFVLWKAKSGDYNNLLSTLMKYSSDPFGEDDDNIIYVDGVPYKKM